jgi:hypothetical protein
VFTQPGNYHVEIRLLHSIYGEISSLSAEVVSRYVRRDIRKLNSVDLEQFMEAMHIIYTLGVEDGTLIYGDSYQPIDHFIALHLTNSVPDQEHDYMHDGMGFLSQHIAITNEFEQALQVVNPSVSIPYWDFTQDYTMISNLASSSRQDDVNIVVEPSDLWTLDIWGEDYFGSSVGSKLNTVTKGRWAYTLVPKADSVNTVTSNA